MPLIEYQDTCQNLKKSTALRLLEMKFTLELEINNTYRLSRLIIKPGKKMGRCTAGDTILDPLRLASPFCVALLKISEEIAIGSHSSRRIGEAASPICRELDMGFRFCSSLPNGGCSFANSKCLKCRLQQYNALSFYRV